MTKARKPELTPHEEYTVAQVKALLKQWPKTLALELDEDGKTLTVYKRDPPSRGFVSATEAAAFRKPTCSCSACPSAPPPERSAMNLETLQPFCKAGDLEMPLCQPYTIDGFTYATDGFVIVRVPAIPGALGKVANTTPKVFADAGPKPLEGWIDLPELAALQPCPKCKGGKKPRCEECDGEGTVTLSNSFSTYDDIECASCGGSGEGDDCDECWGSEVIEPEHEINIGEGRFKTYLIRQLKTLPGVQIAPMAGRVCWLRFDGGDALIMSITCAK